MVETSTEPALTSLSRLIPFFKSSSCQDQQPKRVRWLEFSIVVFCDQFFEAGSIFEYNKTYFRSDSISETK